MMYVKYKRTGVYGVKGTPVQVTDEIGARAILDGSATKCEAPKSKRPKISDKALSAAG